MTVMSAQPATIVTHSPEETQGIGHSFGEMAQPGDVLLLVGDLGAGKTCFTQGMAWGIRFEGYATSPSFVLAREYHGRMPLYHVDFYRLDGIDEIAEMGIDDYLNGTGVCVIEWADKAMEALPADHLLITFEHLAESRRRLRFYPRGARYAGLLEQAKETWNLP